MYDFLYKKHHLVFVKAALELLVRILKESLALNIAKAQLEFLQGKAVILQQNSSCCTEKLGFLTTTYFCLYV